MHVPFLNLAAQHAGLREQIGRAVEEVLASGHYILGPNVAAFESELASYVGVRHGIGVNSGSDALTLTLRALDVGPGDEVITTPFTYIAPAEAIHQMGARIVFADIDPQTFNVDVRKVAERITNRTKAIIPVHLFGQAANLDALQALVAGRGVHIVAKIVAQAIGTRYRGRAVGSFGAAGCFSFYPTKNLGAAGDGGMIVTNDDALAKRLRMLRVHGIEKRYYHDLHGYNSRMDEMQAAILRVKLRHVEQWSTRRRTIAERYDAGFVGTPVVRPITLKESNHVYHVYAVLSERRDALAEFLKERGVPTIIYYPLPLHLQKVYSDLGYKVGDFPVAESVAKKILPLPMYPELTDEQVDYVIGVVKEFCGH